MSVFGLSLDTIIQHAYENILTKGELFSFKYNLVQSNAAQIKKSKEFNEAEYEKFKEALLKESYLKHSETILWTYLLAKAIKLKNKKFIDILLFILCYKFYRTQMNRYFPKGINQELANTALASFDKRSLLKKLGFIGILQHVSKNTKKFLPKPNRKFISNLANVLIYIRNTFNQIAKKFARYYYKKSEQYFAKGEGREISWRAKIEQSLMEFTQMDFIELKHLVKKLNPDIQVNPKYIAILLEHLDSANIELFTDLFELVMRDDSINERNLMHKLVRIRKFEKPLLAIKEWMKDIYEVYAPEELKRIKKMSTESRQKITKYFLLTIYKTI